MSASSEPSRSELLAEIEELRAKVARLRDLLGLAGRTGDEHQRSWANRGLRDVVAAWEREHGGFSDEELVAARALVDG